MIDRKNLIVLHIVIVILAIVSCSVKEDRDVCPCLLSLDFRLLEIGDSLELSVYEDSVLYLNSVFASSSIRDGLMQLEVPRGNITLAVSDAISADGAGNVLIPYGSAFSRQNLYVGRFDTMREDCGDSVILHKNHCILRMSFLGTDMVRPYTLKILGNVNGSKWDGSPHTGSFCVELPPSDEGTPPVCIPRQKDGSLLLDIMDRDRTLRSFALGEYILASGYDWNAEDLADLEVCMDFARYRIALKSELWDNPIYFHIEI